MSDNSTPQPNVVFDAPRKNWGGEWYFLQNRPLNLAQLTVIEWREIVENDPKKAANYLLYILSLSNVDQSDDRVLNVKKLYEDPSFDVRQFQHLQAVFEQANRVALGLLNIFQVGFKHSELEYSNHYPPVHVNKTLARQLSRDLLILETAFSQRKRRNFGTEAGQERNDNTVSVEGHLLHMADLLAYDSLQPLKEERHFATGCVKKSIIPENTVAITYMRERINIRLIPYYPIALIGIPTALSNEWYKPPLDFLVIPHEVGHYLHEDGIYEDKDYPYFAYANNTLLKNQAMERGKKYEMNNHYIRFQDDGNLCIHRTSDDGLVWCLNTMGITYTDVGYIKMQDDGNFVIHDKNDQWMWSAIHANPDPDARLILTIEGRLQLYSDNRGLLWSSENPKTIEEELSDRLKVRLGIENQLDWRKRWLEEIFADCYGVMVAGPIAILAIQEMLASRQLEDLDNELGKGEHPLAILRPLILTNFLGQLQELEQFWKLEELVNTSTSQESQLLNQEDLEPLRKLDKLIQENQLSEESTLIDDAYRQKLPHYRQLMEGIRKQHDPSYSDSIKNLDEHWHNFLNNYDSNMADDILSQKHPIRDVKPDKKGSQILDDLKAVTQEILELFTDIFPKNNSIWKSDMKWSHDTKGNYGYDGDTVACMEELLRDYSNVLVEQNYRRVISPPEVAQPNININGGAIYYAEHDNHKLIETPFTRDLSWVTVELREFKQGSRDKLLTAEWEKLLQVQGWIDEGGDESHPTD